VEANQSTNGKGKVQKRRNETKLFGNPRGNPAERYSASPSLKKRGVRRVKAYNGKSFLLQPVIPTPWRHAPNAGDSRWGKDQITVSSSEISQPPFVGLKKFPQQDRAPIFKKGIRETEPKPEDSARPGKESSKKRRRRITSWRRRSPFGNRCLHRENWVRKCKLKARL